MADPVTLAMVGAAAGAALKPKDPLKGAMLGATVGFTGGTALGAGAAGAATGATGAAAGAGTGIGAGGAALPGVMGAVPSTLPMSGVAGSTLGSGFTTAGMPNVAASMGGVSGNVAPSFYQNLAGPTLWDKVGGVGKWAYENPKQSMQVMNATQGLLEQGPTAQAVSGQVQRGQPLPPVDFAKLLSAQQYNPQPISLLG